MDNIRATIKTLFSQINPNEIIGALLQFSPSQSEFVIDEQMFCQKFMIENKCYTIDQVCELYRLWQDKWSYSPSEMESHPHKNLFHILLHFTKEVLTESCNTPVCRYTQLLRWRMLSNFLSESLFITAFLAEKDVSLHKQRNRFDWNITIGHDNACINSIMKKGVTDLHFHLRGSSLNYELNWLCLMNHIKNRHKDFRKLEKCLSYQISTKDKERWDSFHLKTVKACAIRYYLFQITKGIDTPYINENLHKILQCNQDFQTDIFEELTYYINTARTARRMSVAEPINSMLALDYAIDLTEYQNICNPCAFILSGERKLMYKMFCRIYSGEASHKETMLFYIYLLQKTQIRKELIQLNDLEGFNNFADYEHRKELFTQNYPEYQKMTIPMAIHSAFAEKGLKYLECRISPKSTPKELVQTIRQNDWLIQQITNSESECLTNKYYYIIHFIKLRDENEKAANDDFLGVIKYRHFYLRKKIKAQAQAILGALKYRNTANRIAGVDAANSELYCRPEVFGPVFRFLKEQNQYGLGFTYHVGEDFWDITDGLRAIDEAILFLKLDGNDRMGHALALGIDVKKYYRSRNYCIVMSKQNWMDNAMWMHYKARELGINMPTDIVLELEKTFSQFYDEIYLDNQHLSIEGNEELLKGRDINVYRQSWLLRGDDPEYYTKDLNYLTQLINTQEIQSVWFHSALLRNEDINLARKHKIAFYLYHLYQYDANVRRRGSQQYEKKISPTLVKLIEDIQEGMRKQIAHKHLCIEANITSNLFIGRIGRYMQHPIIKLYKKGLHKEDANPHSISISINTDDKGIFNTSIEEEYALIALALEKEKEEENTEIHKHSSWDVYEWLDNIRQIGWTQCFKQNN